MQSSQRKEQHPQLRVRTATLALLSAIVSSSCPMSPLDGQAVASRSTPIRFLPVIPADMNHERVMVRAATFSGFE